MEKQERIEKVLSKREEAMKVIDKIREKTGIPTREETDAHFYSEHNFDLKKAVSEE